MAQLAIRGHATRGKEVIEILEMFGGINKFNLRGNEDEWFVLNETLIQRTDRLFAEKGFSLEEFLEKFPYKIGDKVSSKYLKNYKIEKMEWEDTDNRVIYKLQGMGWYSADELQPYKEETMEEKINIAELLKDCPKGMELDCTMLEGVYFDHVDDLRLNSIKCYVNNGNEHFEITLNKHGQYISNKSAKCVIFPKGKTTWEGFHKPFEDGDVIFTHTGDYAWISIFKQFSGKSCCTHIDLCINDNDLIIDTNCLCNTEDINTQCLATEDEKETLFQAIKENGYKWNPKTKTLEKLIEPKFKVGDKVKCISNNYQYIIKELTDTHYTLVEVIDKFQYTEPIIEDKNWELVPHKFDINTLVPFESKVLVRNVGAWEPAFWGYYSEEYTHPFVTVGGNTFAQCIPYEENKHLLGTTDDCNEYYKTWEE